jgi:hypothetical protein
MLPSLTGKEAPQNMRNPFIIVAIAIVMCGCNDQAGLPRLEPLARGLAEGWQPEAVNLKLEIHPDVDGQAILHCVLRNVSAKEIDVDQESLPWNNADAFSLSAVAANGDVIKQKPLQVSAVIAHISAPHMPVPLAPGEHIDGNLDLNIMQIGDIPHNKDILLLWSFPRLKDWASDLHYMLSGITLVKVRSPAPIAAAPKTLPGSAMGGTSVSP